MTRLAPEARLASPTAALAQWPVLALLLALAAVILHLFPHGHDVQRLSQLGVLGCAALYLVTRPRLLCWPAQRAAGACLILFFLLGLVSSSVAYAPALGLLDTGVFFLLLVIALAAGRDMAVSYEHKLGIVLKVIAAGCCAYVLTVGIGLSVYFGIGKMPHISDLISNFDNYRSFNYAQTITLPLLALLCARASSRTALAATFLLTACWWALVFATGARGVLLAMGAAVLGVLVLRRRAGWRFCAVMLLSGCAGYVINVLVFNELPLAFGMEPMSLGSGLAQRTAQDPTSSRSVMWQRCVEFMLDKPLLGIGPMHFAHYGKDLNIASSPHSWLFQFGAEWGVLALLCVLVAIGAGAVALIRTAAPAGPGQAGSQQIASALLAGGIAILVDGLVSGSLVMIVSQLLIALYLACACGWVWSHSGPPPSASAVQRYALTGAILAALLAVTVAILPHAQEMWARHLSGKLSPPAKMYYPRFWFDGRF